MNTSKLLDLLLLVLMVIAFYYGARWLLIGYDIVYGGRTRAPIPGIIACSVGVFFAHKVYIRSERRKKDEMKEKKEENTSEDEAQQD
jgi:hypothetical protein